MARGELDGAGLEVEFRGAELGDLRRTRRLIQLARALDGDPGASLPDATETEAALEGAYRLLRNDEVSAEGILAGHYGQTVERAATEDCVIAVHDTTIFEFSGEVAREGLGPLRGKGQGFLAHMTLLVAVGEPRRPLGVVSLETIVRERGRKKPARKKAQQAAEQNASESVRWINGVRATERRLEGRCSAIHVMDREGDAYPLLSELLHDQYRFVVRSRFDRFVSESKARRLSDVLAQAVTVVERTVTLSSRHQDKILFNRKRHPARTGRLARLALSAASVEFCRPQGSDSELPETLSLNVVQVREVETHGENEPVHWTLITTEPIATAADIERVVDAYRARWIIEEYFKAIKTGCAYEKRQLESMHTLLNALAILIPIAWRLLLLRTLSRETPDQPATQALTATQLEVLEATSPKPLPPNLTLRQAMLAVAALGGHIKNNGDPGWLVLGRGYEKLLVLERGWLAARLKRRDQS